MTQHVHNATDTLDPHSARLVASGPDGEIWVEQWRPGDLVRRVLGEAVKLLVLDGGFSEAETAFGPQSWLRLPKGETLAAQDGPNGCTVWIAKGAVIGNARSATTRAAIAIDT
jgi:hypothetical protein